jgi:uncharacterized protein (DUF1501 family)
MATQVSWGISRRRLLQLSAGASALLLVKALESGGSGSQAKAFSSPGSTLVLLELKGGNDGLNTLAPINDPVYQRARPTLALRNGIPVERGLAMHPELALLEPALRTGRLSWVLGVGWGRPSRSHFKAMDQWATGSESIASEGWLARLVRQGGNKGPLVALGPEGSAALEGEGVTSVQMGADMLAGRDMPVFDSELGGENNALARLLAMERQGQDALRQLRRNLGQVPPGTDMPGTPLGRQLALALRLISSGLSIPVIQVSLGGFDTHSNQANRQRQLFRQLGAALAGFDRGLQRLGKEKNVLLMAYSEFGRRLQENSSSGTDHGSASVALLIGRVPRPAIMGAYPSLTSLDNRQDLIPTLKVTELQSMVRNTLSI